MAFKVVSCDSAEEYLNQLSLSNPEWWKTNNECQWIFRGQCSSLELIPSLYRKQNSSSLLNYQNIFDRFNNKLLNTVPDMLFTINNIVSDDRYKLCKEHKERLAEIIKAAFVEIMITEKFIIKCNEVRLQTPTIKLFSDQYSDTDSVKYFYNKLETQFIKEFLRVYDRHSEQNYELFNKFLSFDFPETIALARHHSILSRLLDWTKDPMVAAFFSASCIKSNNKICVWALDKRNLNASAKQGQILFYENLPTTGLEYLHLQRGLFTDMIGIEEYYYKYGEWPTLNKYLSKTCTEDSEYFKQEDYLKKIELTFAEVNKLLLRLDRMGINKYRLMPTYDNVGQSIFDPY